VSTARRYLPAPWWALLTLPFGLATGYANVTVPFVLRQRGLPMVVIATVTQVASLPHVVKLFWAPALDSGPKRRSWFFGSILVTAACLAANGFVPPSLTERAGPVTLIWVFTAVLLLAQAAVATSSTAVLALVALTVPDERRGAVSGWQTAGNLGGMAAGGALLVWLNGHVSPSVTAICVAGLCAVSAAPAIFVSEEPLPRRRVLGLFVDLVKDLGRTLRAREGWTGLLICLSPVGAGALTNLFGALARDYAPDDAGAERLVLIVTGLFGGVVNALGAVLGGYVTDRMDRRLAYLLFGGLTAICALATAAGPTSPATFSVGCLAYQLANGMAYAAFYAFVLELIGRRKAVTTQLALYAGASNLASTYVTWLDGWAYDRAKERLPERLSAGAPGMLTMDATATIVGIAALWMVMGRLRRPAPSAAA
jgi:MFS transporter, PAT family, beta-lactamase induction signal transducer AmpG